jgi:hypothetical protein
MAGDAPDSTYPGSPPGHWPARLPPPDPSPPPKTRGGAAAIIAGAVVFAVAVTYGLGLALVRADDPGRRVAGTLPAPTTTAPVEGEVPLAQAVPALIFFVEQQRASRFDPVPSVRAQPEAEFSATAGELAVRDLAVERQAVTLRALGVIGPAEDLHGDLYQLAARSALAAYDASKRTVFVRSDMTTPFSRAQIVAALTLALDEQLPRPKAPPATAYDQAFAVRALGQGSGAAVAAAYASRLNQADQIVYGQEEREVEGMRGVSGAGRPAQLFDRLPLLAGRSLVLDLLRQPRGGPRVVDQAIAQPPASSEQAFNPAAYEQADEPLVLDRLPAPAAPARLVDSGRYGFADVLMTLFPSVEPLNAQGLAGWGGGRYLTWQEGGEDCVLVHVAGDTDAQTTSLFASYQGWASRMGPDATVEEVDDATLGRQVVELRRCA